MQYIFKLLIWRPCLSLRLHLFKMSVGYDLDCSGGLMDEVQKLVAPPGALDTVKKPKTQVRRGGRTVYRDMCSSCKEGGDLICCDKCPAAFHLACHNPPLEEEDLSYGEWLCHQCTVAQGKAIKRRGRPAKDDTHETKTKQCKIKKSTDSALITLAKAASVLNPKEFELTKDLYCPVSLPGTSKVRKTNRKLPHELDNGIVPLPAKLCYECSRSCRKAPLLQCDFCPLYFHLDCLNPPLSTMPVDKWMCPNHVEHALDMKKLTSVRLSERIQLWSRFNENIDQHAVKIDFLNKCHRLSPSFRIKQVHPRTKRIAVPESVRYHYKHRADLKCSKKLSPIASADEQEQWLSSVVSLQLDIAEEILKQKKENEKVASNKMLDCSKCSRVHNFCSTARLLASENSGQLDSSDSEVNYKNGINFSTDTSDENKPKELLNSQCQEPLRFASNSLSSACSSSLSTTSSSSISYVPSVLPSNCAGVGEPMHSLSSNSLKNDSMFKCNPGVRDVKYLLMTDTKASSQSKPGMNGILWGNNEREEIKDESVATLEVPEMQAHDTCEKRGCPVMQGSKDEFTQSKSEASSNDIVPKSQESQCNLASSATSDKKCAMEKSITTNGWATANELPDKLKIDHDKLFDALKDATKNKDALEKLKNIDSRLIQILAGQRLEQFYIPDSVPSMQTKDGSIRARALLCPVSLMSPPCKMSYRSLSIGNSSANDVCLSSYGICTYISEKHACIFFDEVTHHYELINYSEHGTLVDNVLYSCNYSVKPVQIKKCSKLVNKVKNIVKNNRKQEETMAVHDIRAAKACYCSQERSSVASEAGWEGAAILQHGSSISFGCLQFSFSIVDQSHGH